MFHTLVRHIGRLKLTCMCCSPRILQIHMEVSLPRSNRRTVSTNLSCLPARWQCYFDRWCIFVMKKHDACYSKFSEENISFLLQLAIALRLVWIICLRFHLLNGIDLLFNLTFNKVIWSMQATCTTGEKSGCNNFRQYARCIEHSQQAACL